MWGTEIAPKQIFTLQRIKLKFSRFNSIFFGCKRKLQMSSNAIHKKIIKEKERLEVEEYRGKVRSCQICKT